MKIATLDIDKKIPSVHKEHWAITPTDLFLTNRLAQATDDGSDSALLLLQPVGEIGNCGKIKQRFAQSFELLILEEPNSL